MLSILELFNICLQKYLIQTGRKYKICLTFLRLPMSIVFVIEPAVTNWDRMVGEKTIASQNISYTCSTHSYMFVWYGESNEMFYANKHIILYKILD